MSTFLSRLGWAAVASCALALLIPTAANAAKTPVELRIVNSKGKVLAEHTQYTGTTRVDTSRRADCFGPGTGGSGEKVRIPGATALGVVQHATRNRRKLNPLLVSDHFSFGLALCGIGGDVAPQTGYWYLKQNRSSSMTGGDQTTTAPGDKILWHLIRDYNEPTPDELKLRAPARVEPGSQIPVRVVSFSENGTRSPAAGVRIVGTGVITDSEGKAKVTAEKRRTTLRARRAGSITSNTVRVCAAQKLGGCPNGHVEQIRGTNRRDRIKGTGNAVVRAYGGKDVIDVRKAKRAKRLVVNCGPGKDRVVAAKGQKLVTKRCQKVVRK